MGRGRNRRDWTRWEKDSPGIGGAAEGARAAHVRKGHVTRLAPRNWHQEISTGKWRLKAGSRLKTSVIQPVMSKENTILIPRFFEMHFQDV